MNTDIEKRDGDKLLKLYRLQRIFTVNTLNGHFPLFDYQKRMYNLIQEKIEILSEEISARAKTRIKNT